VRAGYASSDSQKAVFRDINLRDALEYAAAKGAKVINLSLGTQNEDYFDTIREGLGTALAANGNATVVVAAAGNANGPVDFPASDDSVIAVGATDGSGRWAYSNYGQELDIMAPGVSLVTTSMDGGSGTTTSGTSFAAPQVAGAAALVMSVNSNLKRWDVRRILCTTTDKIGNSSYGYDWPYGGHDDVMGYGRLNAYKAVLAAQTGTAHVTSNITWYWAPTPIYGYLVIDGGTSVTIQPYTSLRFLAGNFTVGSGGTLSIDHDNTLTFASGKGLIVQGSATMSGDLTVTGNVTINSGGTLTVSSGDTLEVASGNLTVNGGTLALTDGATIKLANGRTLTVNNGGALTAGGNVAFQWGNGYSGSISIIGSGSMTVSSNATVTFDRYITVYNDATLSVQSGATLKFMKGKQLYVDYGGTLTATGATFTEEDVDSTWGGIYATCNESSNEQPIVTLTNCTVRYVNGNGVTVTDNGSTAKPILQIDGGTYEYNTGDGVHLYYAHNSSYVRDATIRMNGAWGIDAQYSSHTIGGTSFSGSNITENASGGIRVIGGSPTIQYNRVRVNVGSGVAAGVYVEGVSSGTIANNNIFCNRSYDFSSYDLKLYNSSPTIRDNWLYDSLASKSAEIHITYGSYPDLSAGGNAIHTNDGFSWYPFGPTGYASWAVEWGTNNTASTIYSAQNWWGDDDYVVQQGWQYLVSDTAHFESEPGTGELDTPPRYTSRGKAARSLAGPLRPDFVLMREGHQAERDGDSGIATAKFQAVLEQYPNSPMAHQALRRLYALMLRRAATRAEVDAFLAQQAARPLEAFARSTVQELSREALVEFGDFSRAIAAYRTVAADTGVAAGSREAAWLQVARLADGKGDSTLLVEALTGIFGLGDSTETAKIVRREWPDRVVALRKPAARVPGNAPLLAIQPNPFNPATVIRFSVPEAGPVHLAIHDLTGRVVRVIVDGPVAAGAHEVAWDGRDQVGRAAASGVYFARLQYGTSGSSPTNGHEVTVRRMVLAR